jgi:hypothetical protein
MSRKGITRRAEALNKSQRMVNNRERTIRTGLGLQPKAILLLVATIGAALAVWAFAIRPTYAQISTVKTREGEVAGQVQALQQRLDAIRSGEPDRLAALESRARQADALLPQQLSNTAALELLRPHAAAFGLTVSINQAQQKAPAVTGADSQVLSVTFSGDPAAVRNWLLDLDQLRPMVTVVSVTLRASTDEYSGSADIAIWSTASAPAPTGSSATAPATTAPSGS